VDIIREGGSYSIRFGGRQVASFCEEFSEITGYTLPANTHQQVYITVEPIGQLRENPVAAEEAYIRMRAQQDQEVQEAPPERGGALARSMAEPEPSEDWRREVYSRLHREIGQCTEMLRLLERL
jgi:hypothetical protein